MDRRSIYLAKYRGAPSQRAHFALFVPSATNDRPDLADVFRSVSCKGTIIHVVGEPLMNGYTHEFKRNYECMTSQDLQDMIFLGHVDPSNLFEPVDSKFKKEGVARGALEREAVTVAPPPGGQDIRAPIDGASTKRCQEWTIEYLQRLVQRHVIDTKAVMIAEGQRDPPTHGIFGMQGANRR